MMNKLRFKPSLLFSGTAIQSKLPFIHCNASSIRFYAVFNFVANSSSNKRITHSGPLEEFHFKTSSGQHPPAPSGHEVQVLQKLKCSLPNHSDEDDDDFTELGLPVSKGGDAGLATKLQKPSLNGEPSKKLFGNKPEKAGATLGLSLPGKVRSSTKIPPKQNIHQPGLRFNLEGRNGVSRTKSEPEITKHVANNVPSHKNLNCIVIEKVPLCISISQLKEALSVYGEISNAFMKPDYNGFKSCHIEFKTVESSERALVARRVTVINFHLEIRSLYGPEIITVRISNISVDTVEPTIHSICMSCGSMEGLWRTMEGYVDVLFSVKDHLAMQTVLKKLNEVLVDNCQWSAQLLPKNSTNSMINGSNAKQGVDSQISNIIGGLKKQMHMKRIYLEDLENLHHAIVHLKECPTATHL